MNREEFLCKLKMSCAYTSKVVTLKDFDQICRTCLENEKVSPIVGTIVGDMKVEDLLEYSVMIEVNRDDFLPQNICENCMTELYKIYEFKKSCQAHENMLKLLVENAPDAQMKIKEEPPNINFLEENGSESEPHQSFVDPAKENNYSKVKDEPIEEAPESYKCGNCDYTSSKEEIIVHRREAQHGQFKKHKCQICNKEFIKSKMRQHMRSHTKERPYKCDICPQSFTLRGNLTRHKMTHTGERPHVCGVCGKGFIQATSLYVHEKVHQTDQLTSSSSNIKFTCDICGRGFKRPSLFKAHLEKHANPKPSVKKINKLGKEQETRDYLCDICARAFKTRVQLYRHRLTHGEKKYLCSDCDKSFLNRATLLIHSRTHTGEKPYTCTVCNKSFACASYFSKHVLIHKALKPYSCKYCLKTFTQGPHLASHLKTHTGERPYKCSYCNKSFALNGNLTVHVRIHTGETPYVCSVCNKGFRDSSSMKKHRQRHINDEQLHKTQPPPQPMEFVCHMTDIKSEF